MIEPSQLSTYLAQDRRRALAGGWDLPDRARGTALLADISGFTPLTEKLAQQLGPRRGTEELTRRINAVYDELIGTVERYGGTVVSFAGGAITCWFDQADLDGRACAHRAAACALAVQAAMHTFPDVSLKVAVTTGSARRFVVGNPAIQLLDTLAGATLARLAAGEQLAGPGEVLADVATIEATPDVLVVDDWRQAPETGERLAVIAGPTTMPDLEPVL